MKRTLVLFAFLFAAGVAMGALPRLQPVFALHAAAGKSVAASAEADWRLAVIFSRTAEGRSYLGTAPVTALPGPSALAEAPPAAAASIEVWLARDGGLLGLWYAPEQETYGEIGTAEAYRDDGVIARLVATASTPRPRSLDGASRADSQIHALHFGNPATLLGQCRASEVIVVGRVAGVLRESHTPVGADGLKQHTVTLVAVEEFLHAPEGAPPVVKVYQIGGMLAWTDIDGSRGIGMEELKNPLLIPGERYCLFLNRPLGPRENWEKLGYVPGTSNGVSGKVAELDEYKLIDPVQGRLLLRDGITQVQQYLPDELPVPWRFEMGPQLLGLPEANALALIREEVRAQAVIRALD
jgi:hypothetical protein